MQEQPMPVLSRRSLLIGMACAGLASAGLPLPEARAQAFPPGFSSFSVDVSALKAQGVGPFADLLATATLNALHRSFADRVDPRGPRLVVRLTGLFLTSSPDSGGGGGRWFHGGSHGSSTDSLDGEALAVGRRGEVLARLPQLAARAADTSILTPNEPGRAVALADFYVQWLRRRI